MHNSSAKRPAPTAAAGEMVADVLAFIAQDGCTDADFDGLALRLFAYQFANNQPYRRFCQRRGATLRNVKRWNDIPAVPIDAFKELPLRCEPPAATDRIFMTSGTTRSEVKGRHFHPTLAVYDRSMSYNFSQRFMQGRGPMRMGILFPTETVLANSSLAHYLALAVEAFGTAESRLTVHRSITELAHLAGSFNHVLDRLSSALTTQRRFMADASHELRTPVSIARTAAQVTLGQPRRDEAEYREALGVIAKQTSRLTRLVDDMLVLARADAGGYPIVQTQVRLDQLVAECVREFGAPAEDKNIALNADLHPTTMTGDETLLRRMLSNLIGNGVTYTPSGGSIDVSLRATDGHLLLRVSDSGPGIPAEDRERVFERFVRLDPARAAGGSGLGLAIARWIAEAHEGTLRVESSSPSGSVFVASLRRNPKPAAEREAMAGLASPSLRAVDPS